MKICYWCGHQLGRVIQRGNRRINCPSCNGLQDRCLKKEPKSFRERLKRRRLEKGLHIDVLSKMIYVAPRTYSHYELGNTQPTLATLVNLS